MKFRASISITAGDKRIGYVELEDADLGRLLLALPSAAEQVARGVIFRALSAFTPEAYVGDDD